jgi:protein-disulfide isomerase
MITATRSLIVVSLLLAITASVMAQPAGNTEGRCVGGNSSAPIKIEVFSCYQCPPCRKYYLETIRPLLRDYADDDRICIIYYEFPLEIHDYARDAAKYGEAARSLGQLQWQRVSDALYQHQAEWQADKSRIDAIVSEVLSKDDMDRVRKLIKEPFIEQVIDRDIAEGYKRNILGTPATFIHSDGKIEKFEGYLSYPILKNYIDGLLK